jgi:Tfp pilus assembly protein PilF
MWLRASTDSAGLGLRAPGDGRMTGVLARARLASLRFGAAPCVVGAAVLAIALLFLAACGSTPGKPTESTPQPENVPGGTAAPGAPAPVTERGKVDFERAVGFMRAGKTTEAELEFKQVALQFPQLSAPYVNLGILYRKAGHLDQSEQALKTAVEHNDGSAVAWTELGATQRLRGEFPSAAASYEKAIAADPNFAPAYRNLGVVSDLYLGDPERALTAFERYKELTGEEKPVSTWIAELRQRTGKPPVKRPSAAPAAGTSDTGSSAPGSSDASGTGPAPGVSNSASDAAPRKGGAPGASAAEPAGSGKAPDVATPAKSQAPQTSPGNKPAEPNAAPPPKEGD